MPRTTNNLGTTILVLELFPLRKYLLFPQSYSIFIVSIIHKFNLFIIQN